jgi:hypothetical protein
MRGGDAPAAGHDADVEVTVGVAEGGGRAGRVGGQHAGLGGEHDERAGDGAACGVADGAVHARAARAEAQLGAHALARRHLGGGLAGRVAGGARGEDPAAGADVHREATVLARGGGLRGVGVGEARGRRRAHHRTGDRRAVIVEDDAVDAARRRGGPRLAVAYL